MKWGLWSTTAASNSATPPDGAPEGMAPSTVNDTMREQMASIRTGINDLAQGFVDLGMSPTFQTTTTFTVPQDQTQYLNIGRRIRASDTATLYGTVISSSFTTNTGVTIRLDSGLFTASLTAIAVGTINPSNTNIPANYQRFQNPIINGQMDRFLRTATLSLSGTVALHAYAADKWFYQMSATANCSVVMGRAAGAAPTLAQAGIVINNALQVSVTGAMATQNSGTFALIGQTIEGYTWRQYAQKPFVFQFWVNSTLTGNYSVALTNAAGDRTYIASYSISAASAWELKTVRIPESPAAGTWDYSTGAGLNVFFTLAAGGNARGGGGNWTATNILATSAQVNFLGTSGNKFMVTGVQMNDGIDPLPLQTIDYAVETARMNRYCNKIESTSSGAIMYLGFASNATSAWFEFEFPEMRVAPNVTGISPANTVVANAAGATSIASAGSVVNTLLSRATLGFVQAGGGNMTAGQGAWLGLLSPLILDADF